jgi:GDP-4-dehydro-6-deoxy-D-mannose reductase
MKDLAGSRALITGASGFIGGYLMESLRSSGMTVLGIDNMVDEDQPSANTPEARIVPCDVTNFAELRQLTADFQPDFIYHLAAQSLPTESWRDPWKTMETNSNGTINVLEAVRAIRTKPHVFVACSSAEYGLSAFQGKALTEETPLNPVHPYGVSKVAQDLLSQQYFHTYGIHTIRGRIFNTIGPGKVHDAPSDFARKIVAAESRTPAQVSVGNLKAERDFTDVRDQVRSIRLLTEGGEAGQVYNLSSGHASSMQTVIDILVGLARTPIAIVHSTSLDRPTDEPLILGDNRRLVTGFGWKPQYELKQTLRDIVDYWRARPEELTVGLELPSGSPGSPSSAATV